VDDQRETKVAMVNRAKSVLDKIFDEGPAVTCERFTALASILTGTLTDLGTVTCCTIHGGLINAFLSVLGRPKRSLSTGCQYSRISFLTLKR
jgi:hypothetical protein